MRISRIFVTISIVFLLLLPGEGSEIVFEEVGQFNDGGMAVTVLVVNDRAYVCEFDKGLEILDISDPTHIVKLGQIEVAEQARGIEIIGDIAYVSCNVNGLKLFDISDPSQPVYLGEYSDRDGDPHQFLAAGDIGYLTEWHGGFDIIDISDPIKPVRLSQHKDDGLAFSVDIIDSHAFVTGYKAGLKILDISDSKNPVQIGDFNNGGETNALHVVDGKAYVCDKLQGLEILDVSDSTHPKLLGTFKGEGSTVGVHIVDDMAFVINWELGLEAIDVSDPAHPVRIGSFFDGGRPNGFQVVGDLIFMADGSDGLEIIRYTQQKDSSVFTGPYLGQKPPGMTPEVFVPGFISTDKRELNSVFTPDGKEFYYSIQTPGSGYKIHYTKETENGWTMPKPVSFSSNKSDVDMCITHDGKRMYFGSTRPVKGVEQGDFKIWYVDRVGAEWSEAKYLESPVNEGKRALYPTLSNNGTMFFQAIRKDVLGERDIYYSELVNGKYTEPVHLGSEINTKYGEGDVLIAPDETYMIVNSNGRPDDLGKGDLYISFKKEDGTWSQLKNMGDKINTSETEYCPMLSPDGKYFFFTSRRTGNGDIYWVEAKIIEELRPGDSLQF